MRRFILFLRFCCILFLIGQVHADQSYFAKQQLIKQQRKDALITTAITQKYAMNKGLNQSTITVVVQQGVVKLSGCVKDKQAFVDALRYAISTEGVHSVDADDLDIKRINTTLTDAYITAKIEAAILKAKVFDDESIPLVGINATTTNGIVTLAGHLKHYKSIAAILKRANEVHGVKKIISHLKTS